MVWRIQDLPELQHLTDTQRNRLIRNHAGKTLTARLWINSAIGGFALMLILALVLSVIVAFLVPSSGSLGYGNYVLLAVWPLGTLLLYQYNLIRIRSQIRLYLEELRGLGVRLPICVNCGYAVEDTAETCPECGANVRGR